MAAAALNVIARSGQCHDAAISHGVRVSSEVATSHNGAPRDDCQMAVNCVRGCHASLSMNTSCKCLFRHEVAGVGAS